MDILAVVIWRCQKAEIDPRNLDHHYFFFIILFLSLHKRVKLPLPLTAGGNICFVLNGDLPSLSLT